MARPAACSFWPPGLTPTGAPSPLPQQPWAAAFGGNGSHFTDRVCNWPQLNAGWGDHAVRGCFGCGWSLQVVSLTCLPHNQP